MKSVQDIADKKLKLKSIQLAKMANYAVKKAKEENRKFNIPEYTFIKGIIYYFLPNGELSTNPPE